MRNLSPCRSRITKLSPVLVLCAGALFSCPAPGDGTTAGASCASIQREYDDAVARRSRVDSETNRAAVAAARTRLEDWHCNG